MKLTIERPEIHTHRPCGHRDRCNSTGGAAAHPKADMRSGCPICSRERERKLAKGRGW